MPKIYQMNDQPPLDDLISVEVVYAQPHIQTLLTVKLCHGATVEQAIQQSGILQKHPKINLNPEINLNPDGNLNPEGNLKSNKLGIFGKLTKADAVLRDRDRIEIYRPLLADPKEIRRQRAKQDINPSIKASSSLKMKGG